MDHRILRSGAHLRQHHLHHRGGTHEEGFRAALTSLVNRYAREKNILKDKDENLSGDDVREGLTAVVSVKLTTRSSKARPRPSSAIPKRKPSYSV